MAQHSNALLPTRHFMTSQLAPEVADAVGGAGAFQTIRSKQALGLVEMVVLF